MVPTTLTVRSQHNHPAAFGLQRRGMTLVELLMVVAVMVLLLAVAIPQMRPTIRENKIRDASRQINVFIARAKARAAETGRPVAIDIARTGAGSNIATELFLAESPGSYSGDILGAVAAVAVDTGPGVWRIVFSNSPMLQSLIPVGESFQVRFGQRGVLYGAIRLPDQAGLPYYSIDSSIIPPNSWIPPVGFWDPGPDGEWGVSGTNDDNNGAMNDIREAGWPGSDDVLVGLPFQVFFGPRRVSSSRLQLPDGTAIDLQYSGVGIDPPLDRTVIPINNRPRRYYAVDFDSANIPPPPTTLTQANNTTPVRIIFTPSGDVEAVYFSNQTVGPRGTIHLLVGSIDQVSTGTDPTMVNPNPIPWSTTEVTSTSTNKNVTDPSAIWVSIAHSAGTVTTAENVWTNIGDFRQSLMAARSLAQSSQAMGGR